MQLSAEQKTAYERDGFLVFPNLVSPKEVALLRSEVYSRPRRFPTSFLATFPAVGGIPTVVAGEAESTQAKTSTPWVVTPPNTSCRFVHFSGSNGPV